MRRLPYLALIAAACTLQAAPSDTIYAIARISDTNNEFPPGSGMYATLYQIGSFDLANPTGTAGSYSYSWTSLNAGSQAATTSIARNPLTGQLYVQQGFNSYRSVSASGVVGATSLGTMQTMFGMAFDASGNLYGADGYSFPGRLHTLNPGTGATNSYTTITNFQPYSQFGGGLTVTAGNKLYFANLNYITNQGFLMTIDAATGVGTNVGILTGTGFNAQTDWMSLFSSGNSLYLLNANRLYQVSTADATLTRLGTVTNLPYSSRIGFSGAVGNPGAIPEPSTYGLALGALALAGAAIRRRRRA